MSGAVYCHIFWQGDGEIALIGTQIDNADVVVRENKTERCGEMEGWVHLDSSSCATEMQDRNE